MADTCIIFVVIRCCEYTPPLLSRSFFKSLKIVRVSKCPQFFSAPRMCLIQAAAYRRFKLFELAIKGRGEFEDSPAFSVSFFFR